MKEFEVGDKVSWLQLSELIILKGKVKETGLKNKQLILVEFEGGTQETFTLKGQYWSDKVRNLFHGHNVTFKIEGEEEPKRNPWVNIYTDNAEGVGHSGHVEHKTRKEACQHISVRRKYVATIQLKPGE